MLSKMLLNTVINPPVHAFEETVITEKKLKVYGDYDSLNKTDYIVKSFDGYELHCTYIPLDGSNRFVIISHGHTYTRIGSVKYMHLFRKLGFSCIIYDDRGCGKNAKSPITMGFLESRDLLSIIDDTRKKFGQDIYLGLHGESMGASLSLMALEDADNIKFLISDCGYADLFELLVENSKAACCIPTLTVKLASHICKHRYGFFFEDINPYKSIENTNVPICFIHGENDDFILPSHCMTLYQTAGGYREIHTFKGAGHAQSFLSDPERYGRIVKKFIDKIQKNQIINQ